MTTTRNNGGKKASLPERLLYGVIAAQLAVIALGTAWALLVAPKPPAPEMAEEEAAAQQREAVFTGIGRLRARLAASPQKSATAVVTVAFPYNGSDRAFLEELSLNTGKFRSATVGFFNSIPPDSPLLNDEAALKRELLSRYNALLYLGKIETLYFTEFIIID
ncbi:MAG: hypothetical protein LBH50_01910 [Spirochaetaceae bacterium]|nr:hypothetical protein [Spirochaetaceae bacterium]